MDIVVLTTFLNTQIQIAIKFALEIRQILTKKSIVMMATISMMMDALSAKFLIDGFVIKEQITRDTINALSRLILM